MLLVEGVADLAALHQIPGLITDPASPLLALRACPGAPFCPQALGPTRDLARRLAPQVPTGKVLHISGCAKGCAHPVAADLTLVATPGGFVASPAAAAPDVAGPQIAVQDLLHIPNLFAHFGAA
jgi:precorrin-3B synthase